MAFAVHVNINRCTGCGNCVGACPYEVITLSGSGEFGAPAFT